MKMACCQSALIINGGFVIIDDYIDWHTCREAVEDFRTIHGITDPIVVVEHEQDDTLRGVYWRKSSNPCELFADTNSLIPLNDSMKTAAFHRPTADHGQFEHRFEKFVGALAKFPLIIIIIARYPGYVERFILFSG